LRSDKFWILFASSLHELHRNAMVGVPLRLLEYHQRFICLTTNNVSRIDGAFKSRISVDVKYRKKGTTTGGAKLARIVMIDEELDNINFVTSITKD
jgi:hypothetical protein